MKTFESTNYDSLELETYMRGSSSETYITVGLNSNEFSDNYIEVKILSGEIVIDDHILGYISTGANYEKDIWYKINVSISVLDKTWKVFIDNGNETTGAYDFNFLPCICYVMLETQSSDPQRIGYFDEILVYSDVSDPNI